MLKPEELLRIKFKSQTDIDVIEGRLTKYEKWLEEINIEKLNSDIALENDYLRKTMDRALEIIYSGISSPPKEAI